jgi:hypothetical protein
MAASRETRDRPPCPRYREPMNYVQSIPAVDSAPELHIYVYDRCGNVITREAADAPMHP